MSDYEPDEDTIFTGTIWCNESNKELLETLGITVGSWDETNKCFIDCGASSRSLRGLDKYWGRWIWLFKTVEEGTNDQ